MKKAFKHFTCQPGKFILICLVFVSAGYFTQAAENIHFRVTIIQFDCFRQNKDVIIKWRTDDENELLGYELQRSTDQVRFTTIAQIFPKRGHINDYQIIDNPEEETIVYYRLKIMYPTYTTFSIIKKLNNSVVIKKSVIIQPNIIDDHIELTIEESGAEWGDILIHNTQGILIYFKKQILLTGKNKIILSNLPQIKMGMYFLRIHFSNDKTSETALLMKQ